ncbi:MAG: DUF6733 family protein [Chloroherpetonaceae bacterium]|nr:DUF6733 family protein [Chloroherpetonaceae bacterium]
MIQSTSGLFAQSTEKKEDDSNYSMSVSLTTDTFFGFAPMASGTYKFSDKLKFSFYGIFWSGGTPEAWGNWTEFGIGFSYAASDAITVTPQLGVLGGTLLSGGATNSATRALGDGIVPNLTIDLSTSSLQGQLYAGYYMPIRDLTAKSGAPSTLAYLHYWANLGYKVSSFFSLGVHYEHLINTGGSKITTSTDVYQWIGPYVQFSHPKGGLSLRFAGGSDLTVGRDSFYKMTAMFTF